MGKLVIDGNKVYTVDESCMRRRRLTLEEVRLLEQNGETVQKEQPSRRNRRNTR